MRQMKTLLRATALCLSALGLSTYGSPAFANTLELQSVDGDITLELFTKSTQLQYRVNTNGQQLLPAARLGYTVEVKDTLIKQGDSVDKISIERQSDCGSVDLLCRQYDIRVKARKSSLNDLKIQFRLYNDGFAFRYISQLEDQQSIAGELTEFNLSSSSQLWFQSDDAIASHEGQYAQYPLSKISSDQAIRLPVGAKLKNGLYLSISEANLLHDSGLRLQKTKAGRFQSNFYDASWPALAQHHSAWRYVVISKSLTGLLAANMVERLADKPDSSLFADRNFIKVGKSVWHWLPEGPFGVLPKRQKEYIDVAAELGFQYSLIDAGWQERYPDLASNKDPYSVIADLSHYAEGKRIGLWIWYPVEELADPINRRIIFSKLQKLGIAGIKVDFFDKQYGDAESYAAILSYQSVLKDAAEFQLMVNFHGASKPTGMAYTFPNEMTREGVRGQEFEYIREALNPQHNSLLVFSRYLLGSGDFTPIRFNATKLGASGNTASHQLALAGLLESRVQNFSFSPEDIYRLQSSQPSLIDYLRELPVVWDEVKVLVGSEVAGMLKVAKRRGSDWYVFVIDGRANIEQSVNAIDFTPESLNFLTADGYQLDVWSDKNSVDVDHTEYPKFIPGQKLEATFFSHGGLVLRFKPIR